MQSTYRSCLGLIVLFAGLGCDAFQSAAPPAPAETSATAPVTAAAGVAPTKAPTEGIEWLAHYLGAERVGFGERRCTKDADGRFRVLKKDQLTFRRQDDVNEMLVENAHVESADGAVQRIESRLKFGPVPQSITGVVQGGELVVKTQTSENGAAVAKTIPWPADVRGVDAVERTLAAQPLKPGETRSLKCVEVFPGSVVIENVTLTADSVEETEVIGDRKRLLKISAVADLGQGPPLKSTLWADDAGKVIKAAAPMGALTLYSYLTTEAEALEKQEGLPPDLLKHSMVAVKTPLSDVYRADEMTYRVTLAGDDPLAKLFATDSHQQWTPGRERSGELVVRRTAPDSPPVGWKVEPDLPTDVDRKPSYWIESEDRNVQTLAKAAAPANLTGTDLALALEKFVDKTITNVNFTQAMDTAAGVARSKAGDCTEHAVLLAALARARGLPARVAVGLVYSDHPQSGFYFHMWTEVYVDRWIPLDATMGLGGISAGHLKLASTGLSDGDALASFLPVARVMGKLAIAAETPAVADPAAPAPTTNPVAPEAPAAPAKP